MTIKQLINVLENAGTDYGFDRPVLIRDQDGVLTSIGEEYIEKSGAVILDYADQEDSHTLEDMLHEAISDFDTKKIHNVMKMLEWKWMTYEGMHVPSPTEIYETTIKLGMNAIRGIQEHPDDGQYVCETGGIRVTASNDPQSIKIDFVLETMISTK